MKLLTTLDALLMGVVRPLLILFGLSIAALMVIGIVARAVLGVPVFGLEEVMLFAVMWFYMLGAALASRDRSHLSADFLGVVTSNPRVLRVGALAVTVISLTMALVFVNWSWALLSWGLEKGQVTPVFGLPWWISQASLFAAALLFVAYLLRDLVQALRGRRTGRGDPAAEEI